VGTDEPASDEAVGGGGDDGGGGGDGGASGGDEGTGKEGAEENGRGRAEEGGGGVCGGGCSSGGRMAGKACVLLLNKAELVPPDVRRRWLSTYAHTHTIYNTIYPRNILSACTFANERTPACSRASALPPPPPPLLTLSPPTPLRTHKCHLRTPALNHSRGGHASHSLPRCLPPICPLSLFDTETHTNRCYRSPSLNPLLLNERDPGRSSLVLILSSSLSISLSLSFSRSLSLSLSLPVCLSLPPPLPPSLNHP
jgi:hypothetical protein